MVNDNSRETIRRFRAAVAKFLDELDTIDGIGEDSTGKYVFPAILDSLMQGLP